MSRPATNSYGSTSSASSPPSLDRERTAQLLEAARYRWSLIGRPSQQPPPGDWSTWLCLSGRGWGKTRTGAEWVRGLAESGRARRIALVAPTNFDARVTMVEGESGLLAIAPPWCRPVYYPSKMEVHWPGGAKATIFSAEEPDRLNGPQFEVAWVDELGVWPGTAAWDMLMFGLRLGERPRVCVTTTPKMNPATLPLIKELLAAPTTATSRGTTYENRANLAASFFDKIVGKYAGTQLGRAELNAEILDDVEAALWRRLPMIEAHRTTTHPPLVRVAVAVDPAASSTGAETGIVAAGRAEDGHAYVLDDRSVRGSPDTWAGAAVACYHTHRADVLVAEANNGGDMVSHTIATADDAPPVTLIHASRGKQTRAEPVARLYEQGKVHHVGTFPALEDQQCSWVPGGPSPDRLDALVWALSELMLADSGPAGVWLA